MSEQPKLHSQLYIEGLTSQGEGVARLQGKAVFVSGALPGETVTARMTQEKKHYSRAALTELVQPSDLRQEPACPHSEACGGCVIQHLAYAEQLRWKRQWLADALQRLGGLEVDVLPTIPAEAPFYYRDRVQLHVYREAGQIKLGFYARGSHRGAADGPCLLMRPILAELAALLREILPPVSGDLPALRHVALRCDSEGKQAALVLVGQTANASLIRLAGQLQSSFPGLGSIWANWGEAVYGIYGANWQKLAGEERLPDKLADLRLEISPAAFTQVNSAQARLLYERVAEYAALSGEETVLDVYSGVGLIALWLSRRALRVIGVEEYAPAVADAERNAQLNNIANCYFEAGRAEEVLPRLAAEGQTVDVAVLDPPRSGCAPQALTALAELAPKRIIYVSCDPATLARDLRQLAQLGYAARLAQPLDMFPQTGHVETVCLLEREEK